MIVKNLQTKIPALRIPTFKKEWESKKLNELLSEAKKRNVNLKFSKNQVLSVSGEFGIVNQIDHLGRSYAGESVHNYHIVETGDIVYTKSPLKNNPYGIIKLNKGVPGIVSTLYAVYKVNIEAADGHFLDYYFSLDANTNRYLRPLVKKGAKNDMKINNAYVLHDRIYVPCIDEQKEIASFFITIDDKLQQLNNKKSLLAKYKKGVVQQIFNHELQFKDDYGNDYPDWVPTTIGELSFVNAGATPSTVRSDFWDGNIRWMNSGEVNLKRVYEVENRISELGLKKSSTKLLPKECVLIGLAGQGKTRGTVAINYIELCTNQSIAAILPNQEKFNSEFLYHNLDNRYSELRGLSKGEGGRGGLNLQIIKSIDISLPSKDEQKKIADFLTAIDEKINSTTKQIELTQTFKKGLLQQMFVL